MSRINFLREYAKEGQHYDANKEIMHIIANDPSDWNVSRCIKHDPGINEHHLTAAQEHSGWQVRREVAEHKKVTDSHLTAALNDNHIRVFESALTSSNLKPHHFDQAIQRLEGMDESDAKHPRCLIAMNRNLSEDQIRKLYAPQNTVSNHYLAQQKNLPKDIHSELLRSHDAVTRVAALRHPLTTDVEVHKARHDPSDFVKISTETIWQNRSGQKNS